MIDLGGGYSLMTCAQTDDGPITGYIETHPRPDTGTPCAGSIMLDAAGEGWPAHPRWRVTEGTAEQPISLEPSILCRSCGAHYWVRGGKAVPA